ncbi:MAG: NOP5/NOP56 family protein [Haloarculaceae archaeon]
MTGDTAAGWFQDVDPGDLEGAREAIEDGSADGPADWPSRAVEAGFVPDEDEYYSQLRDATIHAARAASRDRERADDKQLIHGVRAMDDTRRTANELAERVAEWAGSLGWPEDASAVADREPTTPPEQRLVALADRVRGMETEAERLRGHVERTAPSVAPNLAALAGPVLAARLISLAGGLEALAKKPSGTLQVLGAEDALFAHLQGGAPSPKHGVIYTHEYVRGTDPEERGSAARALAGKLTIATRVDHYGGDRRPALDRELEERIERIRARVDT